MIAILCGGCLLAGSALAENVTYEYDALGRVIKVIYPDESRSITYVYDALGNRNAVVVGPETPPGGGDPPPPTGFVVVPLNGFTIIPLN